MAVGRSCSRLKASQGLGREAVDRAAAVSSLSSKTNKGSAPARPASSSAGDVWWSAFGGQLPLFSQALPYRSHIPSTHSLHRDCTWARCKRPCKRVWPLLCWCPLLDLAGHLWRSPLPIHRPPERLDVHPRCPAPHGRCPGPARGLARCKGRHSRAGRPWPHPSGPAPRDPQGASGEPGEAGEAAVQQVLARLLSPEERRPQRAPAPSARAVHSVGRLHGNRATASRPRLHCRRPPPTVCPTVAASLAPPLPPARLASHRRAASVCATTAAATPKSSSSAAWTRRPRRR